MARDDVKASVLDKDWDTLLSADQLKVVVYNINIFPETIFPLIAKNQFHL